MNQLTAEDAAALESAVSFEELRDVALRVIARMPQPVSGVCGPITTGGAGSMEKNLERFEEAIRRLQESGQRVFNQLPFEAPMQRIKSYPYYKSGNHLLETFYLPIFESGLIRQLYFLPGWESSFGATWEHGQAVRLGIKIVYL